MRKENIYLDNHASTKIDLRVVKKMMPFYTNHFGNPHSSSHQHGWIMENYIDLSRLQISKSIGSPKEEIFFTSGATESNNLAIKGVALSQLNKKHIITCVTEHKCVLESCKFLEKIGFKVTYLKVDKNGNINLNNFKKKIQRNTFLVSLMAVNNEIGTIHPLKEIGRICKNKKIFFHTDATQALGKIDFNVNSFNIDLASFSSHKIHGPSGIGALYIRKRSDLIILPLFSGGGQERGLRSGTLPTSLCVGFGHATELAINEKKKNINKIRNLKKIFLEILKKEKINFFLNGNIQQSVDNNINITFPNIDGEYLFSKLDDISLSSGSACGSGSGETSYVLNEIGINKKNSKSTLRIGISKDNTKDELIYSASKIANIIKKTFFKGKIVSSNGKN